MLCHFAKGNHSIVAVVQCPAKIIFLLKVHCRNIQHGAVLLDIRGVAVNVRGKHNGGGGNSGHSRGNKFGSREGNFLFAHFGPAFEIFGEISMDFLPIEFCHLITSFTRKKVLNSVYHSIKIVTIIKLSAILFFEKISSYFCV